MREAATLAGAHGMYGGRRAALTTMHGKEQAISPAFSAVLGLEIAVPQGLDTDSLGTFTREVMRPGNMRETALRKARMGLEASGLSIGLASEGSFGPHPAIPFLPAGRELLVFVDVERGIEIFEEQMSERTNFAMLEVTSGADIDAFLASAYFPDHGLVVRSGNRIVKGVNSRADLDRLLAAVGPVHLETDMRAHMNPTRMGEIARLAERLARRIATPCPACGAPGFGRNGTVRGLPCSACGEATPLFRNVIHGCILCPYEQSLPRDDRRLTASPAECQECNP
jgi:uncharacterized Zn finger protein (UPF0148 family)